MAKRKNSAEAASAYAAKDYYIAQRTELLENAFNAGAAWLYNNQWHDIYEEHPVKSDKYLALYLVASDDGQCEQECEVMDYDTEQENPWQCATDKSLAITHWAYVPKLPQLEMRKEYTPVTTKPAKSAIHLTYHYTMELSVDEDNLNRSLDSYIGIINKIANKPSAERDEQEQMTLDYLTDAHGYYYDNSILVNDIDDDNKAWCFKIHNLEDVRKAIASGGECCIELTLFDRIKG